MMRVPVIYRRPVLKEINPKSKNIIILSDIIRKSVFGDFDLALHKPWQVAQILKKAMRKGVKFLK